MYLDAVPTDPVLYGVLDTAVLYESDRRGRSNTYLRSGNQLASRIGVKGSEDLGGGTQALYVLEAGVNLDTGTAPQAGSIFNRQSFVGLANERYGTVTIGHQYPAYYLFVGLLVRAGAPTGSTDAHPGDIDGLDAASRINNAVSYTSPVWHGVQAGLTAGPGEQAGHQAGGGAHSAAVRYAGGPWHLALGYQLLKNGPSGATWDPNAAGSLSRSPLNAGYLSGAGTPACAWPHAGRRWAAGGCRRRGGRFASGHAIVDRTPECVHGRIAVQLLSAAATPAAFARYVQAPPGFWRSCDAPPGSAHAPAAPRHRHPAIYVPDGHPRQTAGRSGR